MRLRLGPAWEEDHEAGLLSSACSAVGEETTNAVVVVVAVDGSSPTPPKTAESEEIVSGSFHEARDSGILVANSFSGRSSEGECDADDGAGDADAEQEEEGVKEVRGGKGEEDEEGRPSYSEITNARGKASGGEEESDGSEDAAAGGRIKNGGGGTGGRGKGKRCRRGDEGYLGLLLEAVRQVSGELFGIDGVGEEEAEDDDDDDDRGRKAGKAEKREKEEGTCFFPVAAAAAAAAWGPVVRSKRGRSQVLPSRYRDSVLEPWRKQPSGAAGHHHLQRRRRRPGRTAR